MQKISSNLINFLSFTRSLFNSLLNSSITTPNKFFFILGNESCDLDSLIGSLTLAYHRHFLNKNSINPQEKFYIPLINCSKNEILTRFDWNYISELIQINTNDLCFFEEFSEFYQAKKPENLQIILFDHNKLTKTQAFLSDSIVEIIDHHEDLSAYTHKIEKIVKKSGSCCSILSEIIENSEEKLEKLEKSLIFALFTTILLDTLNFDAKLKENRWIMRDFELFCHLSSLLKEDQVYWPLVSNKDRFYCELINLKYSEKQNLSLSLPLIFTKDLKTFFYEFGTVIFTSIFVNPRIFIRHYGKEKLHVFISEKMKGLKLLACVFLFVYPAEKCNADESLLRDFLAFSWDIGFLKGIDRAFEEGGLKMKALEYEGEEEFGKEFVRFYQDVERVYSRKTLEPIIANIKF